MEFSVVDLLALVITAAGLVTALSVLYAKFIAPVKRVVKQVEDNKDAIKELEGKVQKVRTENADDDLYSTEVRAILFESLIAILDGLEQQGSNHIVTEQKAKLIQFMSHQLGLKKFKNGPKE
jgi:hypothetical protein